MDVSVLFSVGANYAFGSSFTFHSDPLIAGLFKNFSSFRGKIMLGFGGFLCYTIACNDGVFCKCYQQS